MAETFALGYVALILIGLLIAVLWIILPFAVFGMKPLLRQVLSEQKRTNSLLQELANRGEDVRTPKLPRA